MGSKAGGGRLGKTVGWEGGIEGSKSDINAANHALPEQ